MTAPQRAPQVISLDLQPKQNRLLKLLRATGPHVATTIGFGGAKGGGKSAAIRACSLILAIELGKIYSGITITIVRRVFDDLKKNHIDPLLRSFPQFAPFYRSGDKELVIQSQECSAKIVFAYAETEDDVKRKFLGGYESAMILVDEAQQFSEEELQWISTAARWTSGAGVPEGLCKTALMFNPGGKGSTYLRRIFWLKQYQGNEQPHSFAFMHVFGWDNYEWFRGQVNISQNEFYKLDSDARFQIFITQTSEGRKYDAFPLSIRAGYLLGSFDHFEGQYFAGVWDDSLCVVDRRKVAEIIQPWWVRWMAQDWGFGDHDCHLWFATGKLSPAEWVRHFGGHTDWPMDIVIAYREQVISNRAEADLAMDIVGSTPEWERKTIQRFFLSQDAFGQRARQQGAHSVGQQFTTIMHRYGLPAPEPADQERVNGWRFMHACLRQANLRGATFDGERAKQGPALFISTDCPNVISSIPMAVRDEKNPEDVMRVAGVLWEDVTDAVRYGLKSMLDPKSKAPREVRARELWNSVPGDDPSSLMMNRHLAMLKFQANEARKTRIGPRRWR